MPQPDQAAQPDTSHLTVEQRIIALEAMIHTVAEHQSKLGAALISSLTQISNINRDLVDAGVKDVAMNQRQDPLMLDRAPLITPGGHPMRKG